jgi:hypothetical protein
MGGRDGVSRQHTASYSAAHSARLSSILARTIETAPDGGAPAALGPTIGAYPFNQAQFGSRNPVQVCNVDMARNSRMLWSAWTPVGPAWRPVWSVWIPVEIGGE